MPFGDGLLFFSLLLLLLFPAFAAGLERIKVLQFVQSFDIGRLLLVKSAERFCLRK